MPFFITVSNFTTLRDSSSLLQLLLVIISTSNNNIVLTKLIAAIYEYCDVAKRKVGPR